MATCAAAVDSFRVLKRFRRRFGRCPVIAECLHQFETLLASVCDVSELYWSIGPGFDGSAHWMLRKGASGSNDQNCCAV